ncbi:MAG TPA: hypothetical protein VFF50_08615 [Candidatus Deferrimicrobiaceae bacterium]|nr:hypothetical protein [Candidatus Deferrimicrobiaceae bacterium]
MPSVKVSTNRDSPKIDFAGVDAGAKIFVGPKAAWFRQKPLAL